MQMFADGLMKGEKILVTGGGTGLGKSMATAFAALGAEVVIWGRRGAVLAEAAKEIAGDSGSKVTPMAVDIRNGGAIDEAMQQIFDAGPLTGLVNNAAGNFISPTEDLSAPTPSMPSPRSSPPAPSTPRSPPASAGSRRA